MRLLVLGSGGKVGRLLRARWPRDSVVIPVWHGGAAPDVAFDILADPDALRHAINGTDAVLLLAGVTIEGDKRPLSANTELAKAVLAHSGRRPVFFCSTAAVYGRHCAPVTETATLAPISPYGKAKQDMERAVALNPNAVTLRIGNVAGADALLGTERPDYTLTKFADGGTPLRSYIGPSLLARVIARLAALGIGSAALPGILNVAAQGSVSMGDLLQAAGKHWVPVPAGPDDIERVELDTSLLWSLLGEPSVRQDAAQIVADWRGTEAAT